ncbi:DUF7344 domain-containing protein [Haladaptatus sp. NG-WS-4]
MTRLTGTGSSTGHAPSLSLDTCFELLADRWRRHLLCYFAENSSVTATTDELVGHLIQEDTSATPDDTTWVKLELHHKHLPKLAAAGVIDYDRRDETVRYHGGKTLEDAVAFAATIEHSQ